jgi:hypothetical protein
VEVLEVGDEEGEEGSVEFREELDALAGVDGGVVARGFGVVGGCSKAISTFNQSNIPLTGKKEGLER